MFNHLGTSDIPNFSFELGGEKKTKGAALQFVRPRFPTILILTYLIIALCSNCISAWSTSFCLHVLARYLRSCTHYVICNTIAHSP